MFHQAGVVLFKGKTFDVLDRRLLKQNKFKDISNNKLVLQLRTVGIIGKLVTGPWMHQLYTSQAITNFASITYIKTCLQNLIQLRKTTLIVLQFKKRYI